MLLSELVYLPATLAGHADVIVHRLRNITDSRLHEYWIASRTRTLRWSQRLRVVTEQIHSAKHQERKATWMAATPLLREVLLCEMTAHVWSSILAGVDGHRGTNDYSAVSQGVLQGHLEVRNRVLNLLLIAQKWQLSNVDRLSSDRQEFERWCDSLLLMLPAECPIECHRPSSPAAGTRRSAGQTKRMPFALVATGMLASCPPLCHEEAPSGGLNRRVSNSILGCLGTVLFDCGTLPLGPFRARMLDVGSECRADIAAWLPPGCQSRRATGNSGMLGRF